MFKTPTPERRNEVRVPIISEEIEFVHDGRAFQRKIGDISNCGLFVKSDDLLPPNADVYVKIKLPGDLGFLNVPSKVVRVNWATIKRRGSQPLGFGIEFQPTAANLKKILAAYVVYLRNKQIISVSKRILEDFFDSKKE